MDKEQALSLREARSLGFPGAATPTSLELPAHLSHEEWSKAGVALRRAGSSVMWLAGDWLIYAETAYPDRDIYAEAKEITGFAENTLWNAAWVCRRIDPSRRRREISFGHHQVVAAMKPGEQSRWLKRAVKERWPIKALSTELRRHRIENASSEQDGGFPQPRGIALADDRDTARDHTRIQWLLLKLGHTMGYEVWPALNDRGRRWGGSTLEELLPLTDSLPVLPAAGGDAQRTVELIDVIWLRKGVYAAAFEIERTSAIYSGLLRMSDLLTLVPNLNIPLYVVAPEERLAKVMSQLNRPTFANLNLNKKCRMITFELLTEELQQLGDRARFLDASAYLEYISVDANP